MNRNFSPKKTISSKRSIIFFTIILFTLAFDFRSDEDVGKYIAISMGMSSLLSGIIFIVVLRYINLKVLILLIPSLLFIFMAISSGLIRGQSFYDVFALSVPFFLFCIAFVSIASVKFDSKYIKLFLNLIIIFVVISVLFKLIFGFLYYGLSIDNVRYQIIAPTLILLFAYGVSSILIQKQKLGNLALFFSLFVLFLSVTRSYIIVFFAVILFLILSFPLSNLIKKVSFILKIFLFLIFSILILYFFSPEVFERWVIRLFISTAEQGVDVTAITRIAEASFQLNKLMEDPINLLTGVGIAAETRFADEYIKILSIVFSDDFEYKGQGFGHNNYVGMFYTGGIIFAGLLIYSMFYLLIKTSRFLKNEIIRNKYINEYHFAIAWGGSSVAGYIIYGFLGGTFGDRLASLSFGIAFGLIFLGRWGILKNEK